MSERPKFLGFDIAIDPDMPRNEIRACRKLPTVVSARDGKIIVEYQYEVLGRLTWPERDTKGSA